MRDDVARLLRRREGHFALESGHHGELWLELELLFLRPRLVEPLADELAERIAPFAVEAVCGPLIEGAFAGLMVASRLDVPFSYTEPAAAERGEGLFPVVYRVPRALQAELRGRRVAIVNDVINAGSAVRGTLEALTACEAKPVAIAALAVLGGAARALAASHGVALEALAARANRIWEPAACPLCARGVPLSPTGA